MVEDIHCASITAHCKNAHLGYCSPTAKTIITKNSEFLLTQNHIYFKPQKKFSLPVDKKMNLVLVIQLQSSQDDYAPQPLHVYQLIHCEVETINERFCITSYLQVYKTKLVATYQYPIGNSEIQYLLKGHSYQAINPACIREEINLINGQSTDWQVHYTAPTQIEPTPRFSWLNVRSS